MKVVFNFLLLTTAVPLIAMNKQLVLNAIKKYDTETIHKVFTDPATQSSLMEDGTLHETLDEGTEWASDKIDRYDKELKQRWGKRRMKDLKRGLGINVVVFAGYALWSIPTIYDTIQSPDKVVDELSSTVPGFAVAIENFIFGGLLSLYFLDRALFNKEAAFRYNRALGVRQLLEAHQQRLSHNPYVVVDDQEPSFID